MLALEDFHHVLHDPLVKVLSSKVSVAVGGDHFEYTIVDGEHSNIKGATTKIEDQDVLLTALLVQTVSNGSRSWLVDNTKHIQRRDSASILGCLTLGIVKISWHSDHSIGDGLSEKALSDFTHLAQDHG